MCFHASEEQPKWMGERWWAGAGHVFLMTPGIDGVFGPCTPGPGNHRGQLVVQQMRCSVLIPNSILYY